MKMNTSGGMLRTSSTYTRATDQDIADLWAFLQTLPPQDRANEPHELGFPFSIRASVGPWKLLFFDDEFIQTDAGNERGQYLVEALGQLVLRVCVARIGRQHLHRSLERDTVAIPVAGPVAQHVRREARVADGADVRTAINRLPSAAMGPLPSSRAFGLPVVAAWSRANR